MALRTVDQLVTKSQVVSLPRDTSVRQASQVMAEHGIGALLIMEDDALLGIFSERDALTRVVAQGLDPDETSLAEAMTANPVTITPKTLAVDALRLMTEIGFRHLPIVEEDHVLGVISLRDFVGAEFQLAGEPA
ncbi:MAG: CBS domain-containing protein [Pseudomonadota bacterium]